MNVLWNGIIVATGDVNVEMLTLNRPEVKKYIGILTSLNLHQHIQHPTRTIAPTKTLIDHIIGNAPNRASHRYVLPCPTTSDHDGPYACINVRVKLFQPHYNVKRAFFRRALSSNKPKELWNTKHRILHPIWSSTGLNSWARSFQPLCKRHARLLTRWLFLLSVR